MGSQIRFIMPPEDERDFEELLLSDASIRLIAGPRWKTREPQTSRSLGDIGYYCIIWSTTDIEHLTAEYIPTCDDWYCRSEYATIQFLRSELTESVLTEGRIAISTMVRDDFPEANVRSLEKRFGNLRKYIKKHYRNSVLQWQNSTLAFGPAGPNRSANPSKPDSQTWVGPHALQWLREQPERRVKQSRQSFVEAFLVESV
jgi:hypothetical protein